MGGKNKKVLGSGVAAHVENALEVVVHGNVGLLIVVRLLDLPALRLFSSRQERNQAKCKNQVKMNTLLSTTRVAGLATTSTLHYTVFFLLRARFVLRAWRIAEPYPKYRLAQELQAAGNLVFELHNHVVLLPVFLLLLPQQHLVPQPFFFEGGKIDAKSVAHGF